MKVQITESVWTKGMIGEATFDPEVGKWMVKFSPVWVGWYDIQQFSVVP
jgi:hypothetical protein